MELPDLPDEVDLEEEDYDEAYSDGDDEIELTDEVLTLAAQIDAINSIEDPDERLQAAIAWAKELNGEST